MEQNATVNDISKEIAVDWGLAMNESMLKSGIPQEDIDRDWANTKQGFPDYFTKLTSEKMGWAPDTINNALGELGFPQPVKEQDLSALSVQAWKAIDDSGDAALEYKKKIRKAAPWISSRDLNIEALVQTEGGRAAIQSQLALPHALATELIRTNEKIPLLGKNPFFDKETADLKEKNPEEYRMRLQANIMLNISDDKRFDIAGVKELEKAGLPHWLADMAMYDFFNPISWVMGKPLAFKGGQKLFKLANNEIEWGKRQLARHMMNWMKSRSASGAKGPTSEALLNSTAEWSSTKLKYLQPEVHNSAIGRITDFADDAAVKQYNALKKGKDLLTEMGVGDIIEIPEELSGPVLARKKFSRARIGKFNAKREKGFTRIVNGLDDDVLKAEIIKTRLMLANNPRELAKIQTVLAEEMPDIDPKFLQRPDITNYYMDPKNNQIHQIEGGLLSDFIENPSNYRTPKGNWKKNAQTSLLKKLLGTQPKEISKRLEEMIPIGNDPLFRDNMTAIIKAKASHPDLFREGFVEFVYDAVGFARYFKGGKGSNVRLPKKAGQRTPLFEPFAAATGAMNLEMSVFKNKLNAIFGGTGYTTQSDLIGNLLGGTNQVRVVTRHPLLKPKPSALGQAANLARKQELIKTPQAAIDEGYRVYFLTGDAHQKEYLLEQGLVPKGFTAKKASAIDIKRAEGVRDLLDEMGKEGVKYQLISPDHLLNNYLPKITSRVRAGEKIEDIIDELKAELATSNPKRLKEIEPFFSRLREGKLDNINTSLPNVLNIYAKELYKAKHFNQLIEDTIVQLNSRAVVPGSKTPKNPKGIPVLSTRDKLWMSEFVMQQLNGNSISTGRAAEIIARGNNPMMGDGDDLYSQFQNGLISAQKRQWDRKLAGVLGEMWAVNFLGGRPGPVLRNLTQEILAVPGLGGPIKGVERMAKAPAYWHSHPEVREAFMAADAKWGWTGNFADYAVAELNSPEAIHMFPKAYRDWLLGFFKGSDTVNRSNTFSAAWIYMNEMVEAARAGNKNIWKTAVKYMDVVEQAGFKQAMQEERYDRARSIYTEQLVNNNQYLYNKTSKPIMFLEQPLLGAGSIFASWGVNFSEATARAHTLQGNIGEEPGSKGRFDRARGLSSMKNGVQYILPTILFGIGLELADRKTGLFDSGDFLLMNLDNLGSIGRGIKQRKGFNEETRVNVPVHSSLGQFVPNKDRPFVPGIGFAHILDLYDGIGEIIDQLNDPGQQIQRETLRKMYKSSPFRNVAAEPALGQAAMALGHDPEGESLADRFIGALFNTSIDADFKRDQAAAFGFKPVAEDSAILPFEGP